METIKVNMTPCEDVQTIHASKNDGEAREWEFELHNNGELIDTSDVTEQMVFKSYKGGTEQLLPENGSTPTTSPFKGDIKYPQGLLSDQEFTYRESPTEKDGLAKITDIKGNTLVWNQLVQQNGATETMNGVSFTNNNDGSWTVNGTATNGNPIKVISSSFSLTNGHKYLVVGGVNGGANNTYRMDMRPVSGGVTKEFYNEKEIWTSNVSANDIQIVIRIQSGITVNNFKYRPQVFDLTALGIDNLTNNGVLEWFADYFPLSYYSYNQGSLLSFNGNGIKTVGFNQWDEEWKNGFLGNNGVFIADANSLCFKNYIEINPSATYYGKAPSGSTLRICSYDSDKNFISLQSLNNTVFTLPSNTKFIRCSVYNYGTTYNNDICINISSNRNGQYEPYTSSTLSLPISTYFPNGMNGFGGVYDELTSTKAITRYRRRVFDGTENWTMETLQGKTAFYLGLGDGTYSTWDSLKRYCVCDKYYATPYNAIEVGGRAYGQVALTGRGSDAEFFADFQNVTEWKTWLSNNPTTFVYEAKTVTEVSFTTATLVTENAEIPLSNDDGVLIGKCTEQLSENPGFIDAKIKLADDDGTCYSNKIQLHVERSPQ